MCQGSPQEFSVEEAVVEVVRVEGLRRVPISRWSPLEGPFEFDISLP